MCIDMRLDCSLSKCLILAFGNISIQNHDSSIYKKSVAKIKIIYASTQLRHMSVRAAWRHK